MIFFYNKILFSNLKTFKLFSCFQILFTINFETEFFYSKIVFLNTIFFVFLILLTLRELGNFYKQHFKKKTILIIIHVLKTEKCF